MKIYQNFDLYKYNTMRLHAIADIVYEPENINELVEVVSKLKKNNIQYYVLSAGSNIVFSERIISPIIYMMSINKSIIYEGDNVINCGSSVRIQSLLSIMKKLSLGGLEFLSSVPSSIGGAVYMNAGRGRKYNHSISDNIVSVNYLDCLDMQIKTLHGNSGYAYRKSPFQTMDALILSVKLKFPIQDPSITDRLIKERLAYSKKYLSADKPSCGSIFNKVNPFIIRLFMGCRRGGRCSPKKRPIGFQT